MSLTHEEAVHQFWHRAPVVFTTDLDHPDCFVYDKEGEQLPFLDVVGQGDSRMGQPVAKKAFFFHIRIVFTTFSIRRF